MPTQIVGHLGRLDGQVVFAHADLEAGEVEVHAGLRKHSFDLLAHDVQLPAGHVLQPGAVQPLENRLQVRFRCLDARQHVVQLLDENRP
ncbi:hypothetical protein D3C83_107890 [compost metagenome]